MYNGVLSYVQIGKCEGIAQTIHTRTMESSSFFNGKDYGIFGDYTTLLFAPFIKDNFVNNYNDKANVQCKR